MIFFLLDILIYNFTKYQVYLVLLNLNNKNNYYKFLIISIILDFIVLNTYYKNIILFIILILINKYILNYKVTNLVNFLAINIINYVLFIIIGNLINLNLSFFNISTTIVQNFIIYIFISLIYYYKIITQS